MKGGRFCAVRRSIFETVVDGWSRRRPSPGWHLEIGFLSESRDSGWIIIVSSMLAKPPPGFWRHQSSFAHLIPVLPVELSGVLEFFAAIRYPPAPSAPFCSPVYPALAISERDAGADDRARRYLTR